MRSSLASCLLALPLLAFAGCSESKTLSVSGVEPATGPYMGGDRVHINGTGFSTMGFSVYFGGRRASNCSRTSTTQITCDSPAGTKDQAVDVQVRFDDSREATLKQAYKYIDPIGEGVQTVPTLPKKE
jgi:hypothetical protein